MMEKRNFVTNARTPMDGAADIDAVLEAGAQAFGHPKHTVNALEKKASDEDERADKDL